jgi:hypothetical protein
LPELMSLRLGPQKQKCRASLPQHSPLHSLERRRAIERSLFEPAEHRPAQRETDSESSRRLPEPEFQVGQVGSPVSMIQRREARTRCFEGLEPLRLAGLPLVKCPAHQSERQLALAFGCHESTCRLSRGKPRAQSPLPATAGRQPPPRFAPGAAAELLSAAERLSSRGCRSDPTGRADAQSFPRIHGSIP